MKQMPTTRESANQYWHPHHWSGSWWQGEEEEHQWGLNERVESEKWLQAAECGMYRGGWFIHGDTQSFCIRAVTLLVDGREMRDFLCITSQHFLKIYFPAQIGRLSTQKVPSLPNVCPFLKHIRKNNVVKIKCFILFYLPFLRSHCVHYSISLLPTTVPPSSFFFSSKPEHDLVMFWIRIHMYGTAQKSSLTNRCCWAQSVGNWAALPWRVLSTVEMDVLMDRRRWRAWSVFFLCAEEPLCKSASGGKK